MHWLRGLAIQAALAVCSRTVFADVTPDAGCETKRFDLTVTWEKHAPDGFEREMALINGQYPGPLLEINEGDVVEINVLNLMPYNTTMHFHGIEMIDTPWADGTPGLTQRQIRTGNSFLYRWKATQYGSYWYHAHQRAQMDDGLYGPLVIHPKTNQPKPFTLISDDAATVSAMVQAEKNVKALVLSDFRHVTSEVGWDIEVASGIETPCYDSILMNGKGSVQCWSQDKIDSLLSAPQKQYLALGNETTMTAKGCLSANIIGNVLAAGSPTNLSAIPDSIFNVCTPTNGSTEVIEVRRSACSPIQWQAIDIIGTFGLHSGSFSIDGHPMYVYAVDGSYIEPQLVEAITITNGNRYSVLVKVDKAGDYAIRFASTTAAQMLTGYGVLSVKDSFTSASSNETGTVYIDDVGVNATSDVVFFDQATMKSYPAETIATVANETFKMAIRVAGASYNWALNSSIFPAELENDKPVLFDPQPYLHNNVTITTNYGDWVDLVFISTTFPMPPHPIHKHGTKMYLIGQGDGLFNYSSVAEAMEVIPESFNFDNPPKRDSFSTNVAATGPVWTAVRYQVTNPGAWFLHCHIQSHLSGGMSMTIQDGVDKWPTVPEEYLNYY